MMRFYNGLPAILAGTAIASAIVITHPQSAVALTGEKVNDIARDVTVLINSINPGSGVIIGGDGNTYYVLTANHVVATEDEYTIITGDKKPHKVDYHKIIHLPKVDLAVLKFTSNEHYQTATLANSDQIKEGSTVFVSGWPNPGREIKERIREFSQGNVTARLEKPAADGYAIVYTNWTRAGMSGGPVLDTSGRVVGIHGRAEGEAPTRLKQESGTPDPGKIGINLAIPINTFLNRMSKAGIHLGLQAENSPPDELTAAYVQPEKPDKRDRIKNIDSVLAKINNGLDEVDKVQGTFDRVIHHKLFPF